MQQPSDASPPRHYRVADLEVDVDRVRVTRDGVELALPRLTFDLLVAFVEIAPAVATSEALLERVWPGLVVSPETLVQRVKLLRAALGDDPRQPRYVAVVRGRGYRLIPDVQRIAGETPDEGTPAGDPRTKVAAAVSTARRRQRPAALALGAVVAILAAAFVATYLLRARNAATAPTVPAAASTAHPTAAGPTSADAADAVTPSRRSVAVLPFEALSRDPEDALYARGIAAAVLHQLGTLRELEVIARRSSFALGDDRVDAREIGRRLSVRYLLEGSVQRAGDRLRVTAQLVDAGTATQVWSMRVDRPRRDLFTVEDEIARKVAEAFDLSTTSASAARLRGQGTRDFDAYLEFLRARALLASDRIADLDAAIANLRRAVAIDPRFAPAYVSLADAEVRRAEFAPSGSRAAAFAAAHARALASIQRALELDPENGGAYLQRAQLRAYTDLAAAEADYQRGLELAPNDADGYAGLAGVVYADPRRTDEALRLLDRARRLDPLEARHDVAKAVLLAYARSDFVGAAALLREVVAHDPNYAPALTRYGEILIACTGETAEGIRVLSRALALDLDSESARRQLVSAYLDVGDDAAAALLVGDPARAPPGRATELHAYRGDWIAAGDDAYAAHAAESVLPPSADIAAIAVRMHARATHEYARARALLERAAGIEWDEAGTPSSDEPPGIREYVTNAAYVNLLAGDGARAKLLFEELLADADYDSRELRRGAAWSARTRATALALLGRRDAAVAALATIRGGLLQHRAWYFLEREPAYEALRGLPAFRALAAESRARQATEASRVAALRAAGEIPDPATLGPRHVRPEHR